ncbi:hypothetical protein DSO57_1025098 [Entomophthora muscae]|uniref:Uncharacterized protein n=1 Tax=Entomophthora muscae TaxID=34485 RepID=A0ACC2TDH5_9FUNG|nr:hypothetical protein DSO57_1025098 [Entomophthora muscae]
MVSLALVLGFCLGLLAVKECGKKDQSIDHDEVPEDCEVWKGNVRVFNEETAWPKNLRVIKGKLRFFNFLHYKEDITVGELHIDEHVKGTHIKFAANATNVYIGKCHGSITLAHKPTKIEISESYNLELEIEEKGIISNFKLINSHVRFTGFEERTIGRFILYHSTVYSNGPLFKEVDLVSIYFTTNPELNITRVTSTLKISTAEEVRFPLLETVGGIYIPEGENVSLFAAPKLQSAQITIQGHVKEIDVPLNMTWEGNASFNADNFCPKFHFAFSYNKLLFTAKGECPSKCAQIHSVTPDTIQDLKECHEVYGRLSVDQNSPLEIELTSLEYVYGNLEVTNYPGKLGLQSLKEIKGSLTVANSSGISPNSLSELESVSDMKITNVSLNLNLHALEYVNGNLELTNYKGNLSLLTLKQIKGVLDVLDFNGSSFNLSHQLESALRVNLTNVSSNLSLDFNSLNIKDSLEISNSTLTSFSGLVSNHLNTLKISNALNLSTFTFQSLESVGDLYIHNTALDLMTTKFHEPFTIYRDMTISEYNFRELKITTANINGKLFMTDNRQLEHVYFQKMDYMNNPLVQFHNQKLQNIQFKDLVFDYQLFSNAHPKALVASGKTEKQENIQSEIKPKVALEEKGNHGDILLKSQAASKVALVGTENQTDTLLKSQTPSKVAPPKGKKKYLKIYITLVLPGASIAAFFLIMYLK